MQTILRQWLPLIAVGHFQADVERRSFARIAIEYANVAPAGSAWGCRPHLISRRGDQITRLRKRISNHRMADTMVVSITREDQTLFPNAETRLDPNDSVLIMASRESERALRSFLESNRS